MWRFVSCDVETCQLWNNECGTLLVVGLSLLWKTMSYAIFNSTVAKESHFFGTRTRGLHLGHRSGSTDRRRTTYSSVSGTKNPDMSYLRAVWRVLELLKHLQASRPNSLAKKLIRNWAVLHPHETEGREKFYSNFSLRSTMVMSGSVCMGHPTYL